MKSFLKALIFKFILLPQKINQMCMLSKCFGFNLQVLPLAWMPFAMMRLDTKTHDHVSGEVEQRPTLQPNGIN